MAVTANSKRLQLDKNKATIFAVVAVAAVVSVAALVIGRGLWNQTNYLGRVADKKEEAVRVLENNKDAVAELAETYKTFDERNPNLLGGDPAGNGERDGSNGALVLDSLPSKYDFPALTASVEKLLTGYTINNITGTDDNLAQAGATADAPVEMPFSFIVVANYDGVKQLIDTFDRSIRPFKFKSLNLSGNNGSLTTTVNALTYYQPETGLKITEESVK